MKRINIVLCEGAHDVAFISRILKADKYKSQEGIKMKDFKEPLKSIFINELKNSSFEDKNIQNLTEVLIPLSIRKKNETFVLLYSMGSDSRKDLRVRLINKIIDQLPNEGEITETKFPKDLIIDIIYFFDVDNHGKEKRIEDITLEIKSVIKQEFEFDNENFEYHQNLSFSYFLFSKPDKDEGKLEDILYPLMLKGNNEVFEKASSYFDNHSGLGDKKKSIIGIAGQLNKGSGISNTAIIRRSSYITTEKIKADENCGKITTFFNNRVL